MESRLKVHILLCFSEYFEITEKFWKCIFWGSNYDYEVLNLLQNADLNKKWKIISYKNYKLFLKVYIKTDKKYQVWWYWNWKTGFRKRKKLISINNIDIKTTVVSNKVSFGKKGF